MAASLPRFRVAKTISGGPPKIEHYKVASGQTFVFGDPVILSATDNEITIVADNPASILGIALADAVPANGPTNVGKEIPVAEATMDTIFSGILNASWAADLVGNTAGIDVTTGVVTVDDGAGNNVFSIRGLDTTDATGVVRVFVSVLAAGSQGSGGDVAAT